VNEESLEAKLIPLAQHTTRAQHPSFGKLRRFASLAAREFRGAFEALQAEGSRC